MRAYLLRVLVAFDVLLMAVMNGKRNETMSAAAWSLESDGKFFGLLFRPAIDWVAWNVCRDPAHCQTSFANEQASPKMRPNR